MGPRIVGSRRKSSSLQETRRKRRQSQQASGGLRANRPRKIEIPELCPDRLFIGAHGRPGREALFHARPGRGCSAAPRLDWRAESLAFECRSGTRYFTRQPRSENLLHHASHSRAAHLRPFHKSAEATPLQLSALPRESPARRLRFYRYATTLQSAPQKERRAHPHRSARRGSRATQTPRPAPPAEARKTPRQSR